MGRTRRPRNTSPGSGSLTSPTWTRPWRGPNSPPSRTGEQSRSSRSKCATSTSYWRRTRPARCDPRITRDHGVVIMGVSLWRSLMRLDLIDELLVSMYPYITDEGTQMFDDVPKSYRLDLVSSTASPIGVLELRYRRHR